MTRPRRQRSVHSAADEKRIDTLQALATERVGRGAAVGIDRTGGHFRVVVFNARGDEAFAIKHEQKSDALHAAIWELRYIGVKPSRDQSEPKGEPTEERVST